MNGSELSKQLVVVGTILLLLTTWIIAIIGASWRSRNLITFTIFLWVIFIVMWLVLSLYFRLLKHNTKYCVANKKRCAPSMWLISVGSSNHSNEDTDDDEDEETTEEESENEEELSKYGRRIWSKNNLPELTVKPVHPMRTYVMTNPVDVTLIPNTVVLNQTSTMIGGNNGCGCDRHQQTTTESPPSDLRTRTIKYRKNMTMYRQAAIHHQHKKGRKKNIDSDGGEGDEEEEEEEEEEGEEEKEKEGKDDNKADSHTVDWLSMLGYLLLYLYALYVLFSYHSELKLMSICECDDNLNPETKVP
ncbi:uncharacterized protein LOC112599960 [Melanaphis sacchari]|uniref:uncharacterized protein LOC112599960 n=1 Tax=Melanaphis sacchari TaxID=742174 RepID=UPI000DC130D0|nr:uncharacterized protein LOC112599960 [Melanaphis sacchari]